MNHLFIPYELAVTAKEKGFNQDCLAYYKNTGLFPPELQVNWIPSDYPDFGMYECHAPLYQQIVDWMREKHNIAIELHYQQGADNYSYSYGHNSGKWYFPKDTYSYYDSFKNAITQAFKLI